MIAANDTSLCGASLVLFLEFRPGHRAEISPMNKRQNSSRQPSHPGYWALKVLIKTSKTSGDCKELLSACSCNRKACTQKLPVGPAEHQKTFIKTLYKNSIKA